MLDTYDTLFAQNTPMVNLRMKDIGNELKQRASWRAAVGDGQVTAYRIGDTVTVESPGGVAVPATMPDGTTRAGSAFGEAYAGERSGWTPAAEPLTLTLPQSAASTTAPGTGGSVPATAPAPDARVPEGVAEPVLPAGS